WAAWSVPLGCRCVRGGARQRAYSRTPARDGFHSPATPMIDCSAVLAELLADPSRAALVPRGEAITLRIELARVARALALLAAAPIAPAPTPLIERDDQLLTPEEAAEIAR